MKRIYQHECASCGEHSFEYHEGSHKDTEYIWVCDDCGVQMKLRFSDEGRQVEQTPTGRRCERTLALLRVRGNPTFMFIYQGCAWDGDMSGSEYFYQEHTCPTNLVRCEEIIASGEEDPHGIFELVEEHLITGDNARPREEVLEHLKALAIAKTKDMSDLLKAPAAEPSIEDMAKVKERRMRMPLDERVEKFPHPCAVISGAWNGSGGMTPDEYDSSMQNLVGEAKSHKIFSKEIRPVQEGKGALGTMQRRFDSPSIPNIEGAVEAARFHLQAMLDSAYADTEADELTGATLRWLNLPSEDNPICENGFFTLILEKP